MNRQQRMNTAALRQNLMYKNGRFSPIGYAKVFWIENGDVLRPIGVIIGMCLFYNWLSIKVQRSSTVAFSEHLKQREELLKSSGKVKSNDHIVQPGRMTEDLDTADHAYLPSGVENPGGVIRGSKSGNNGAFRSKVLEGER